MHDSNNKFISIRFGCIPNGLPAIAKLLQLFSAGHKFTMLRQVNYRLQFARSQWLTECVWPIGLNPIYLCASLFVLWCFQPVHNNNLNLFNRFLKSLMRCDCCYAIAVIINFRYRCDIFDSRIIQLRRGFPLRVFNATPLKRTKHSTGSQIHGTTAYTRCDGVMVWATLSKAFPSSDKWF